MPKPAQEICNGPSSIRTVGLIVRMMDSYAEMRFTGNFLKEDELVVFAVDDSVRRARTKRFFRRIGHGTASRTARENK